MLKIKICGITNFKDAKLASELGVDIIGFVFAMAFRKLNSQNSKVFFCKFLEVIPFKIKRIQTDNGREFEKNCSLLIRK